MSSSLAMAAQMQVAWRFHDIQILRDQPLGHGSYGAVYRAKADQLPCAVKILHPIFFRDRDPGAQRIQQRFEQECQLLSCIRHPNIVQYLGTCTDRESGLPALLMELMDESLTHFLENSPDPLPCHLEVNLSHDIALALDYLHSHEMVHRDLSSNNVLLITSSRAKVTDFGMSKLLDTTIHMTPQTQCPGATVYMSPEALRNPPVYSKKLDCFSFGVLGIQIMSRKFPDPGPAQQAIEDARSPVGTTYMPVLERERRKCHIDLIPPNHPLLSIALQCLEYRERNRPSAQELCDQLATLKEDPQYTQSVQQAQERGRGSDTTTEIAERDEQLDELRGVIAVNCDDIRTLEQRLDQRTAENASQQERNRQLQHVNQQSQSQLQQRNHIIREQDRRLQELNDQLQRNEQATSELRHLNRRNQQELQQKGHVIEEQDRQLQVRRCQLKSRDCTIRKLQQSNRRNLKEKACIIQEQGRQLRELDFQLQSSEQANTELRNELSDERTLKRRRQQAFEYNLKAKENPNQALRTQLNSIKRGKHMTPQTRECPTITGLVWKPSQGHPEGIAGTHKSVATFDDVVYVCSDDRMYAFGTQANNWLRLPNCPNLESSLVVVGNLLTAVGGRKPRKLRTPSYLTNTLLSLTGSERERKWSNHFPPMPTPRSSPAVVCSGRTLVAAGGEGFGETGRLSIVEVMDTHALHWFTVDSLLHPFSQVSIAVCKDDVYLMGGNNEHDRTKSVLTCSLTALRLSCQADTVGKQLKTRSERPSVWRRVADLPVYYSACTALDGQLLAIGGQKEDCTDTVAVYEYDPSKSTWNVIDHMPIPVHSPSIATLSGNRFMVLVGSSAYTASLTTSSTSNGISVSRKRRRTYLLDSDED